MATRSLRLSIPSAVKPITPVFADADDPELAVLGVHFLGDFEQPVLVLTEHLGDVAEREDVADLVDVSHHQADCAARLSCRGADQFHGSNSPSRLAGGWR